VSHLRFGPEPIHAPYLVQGASFVGCHQAELLERVDVLGRAAPGATLLLNTPRPETEVWDSLPRPVQKQILAKKITLYAIDASEVGPAEAGLPGRINTVLQTCFFAISGVLRGRRPSRRSSRPSPRPTAAAAPRSWTATTPPWTGRWPRCTRSPSPPR
jgi:Pyruvate:ferredoxin oxidoreductase and related 2-oxoacid:ferredoxin oxidoreductases, gamma subunit